LRLCLRCGAEYQGESWHCVRCGYEPARINGYPAFAPEHAGGAAGYDPAHFSELARLEAENFWFRARNLLIAWAIGRYCRGARNLLEVGCGTGFVLAGIAAAFPSMSLAGGESASEGLTFAAIRVPGASFMQLDARRIPFSAEFDVVAAFDVIEHIEDDRAVLQQLRAAATPGGGVLITVPQHRGLWSEYDARAGHIRRYRARELRAKVMEAGLEIVRMTSFVALLLPFMYFSRLAQRTPRAGYDPLAELRIAPWLNRILETALDAERALIQAGMNFPAGGSLLVVARRPASPR